MKSVPWSRMRKEYEGGETQAVLAERYGVSVSSVSRRARLENWGRRGSVMGRGGTMEEVSQMLLNAARTTLLCPQSELSVRDMKDLAALVREVQAMRDAQRGRDEGETVRVVLEGEVEEWSR